jgi:hypothetical protein
MSCCGKMRSKTIHPPAAQARPPAFVFEYVGRTGLTIIGPGTRTSYRFDRPGSRVMVDARDRASLASVPVLRQVSA